MMNKFLALFTFLVLTSGALKSQTQNDTIFNYITKTPVTIDGQATEECWTNAEWHNIDQVWIPYAATMKPGDFEGKFKVAWDEQYLYVLVEVVDDSLSDDFSNPLQNWWDDDCLEIFIDENRSKGDHKENNNAFAYHVSLLYDAIDLNSSGGGVNYKDNIEVDMDTIGEKTYLWEFAIKNYNANFNISNPEASRVQLSPNKLMGFAIAYCDNDETGSRENFIGSMKMASATANDMYINANYFGSMLLIDPDYVETPSGIVNNLEKINVYPNPATSQITLTATTKTNNIKSFTLSSITGQVVKSGTFMGNSQIINLEDLNSGIYLLKANFATTNFSTLVIKE